MILSATLLPVIFATCAIRLHYFFRHFMLTRRYIDAWYFITMRHAILPHFMSGYIFRFIARHIFAFFWCATLIARLMLPCHYLFIEPRLLMLPIFTLFDHAMPRAIHAAAPLELSDITRHAIDVIRHYACLRRHYWCRCYAHAFIAYSLDIGAILFAFRAWDAAFTPPCRLFWCSPRASLLRASLTLDIIIHDYALRADIITMPCHCFSHIAMPRYYCFAIFVILLLPPDGAAILAPLLRHWCWLPAPDAISASAYYYAAALFLLYYAHISAHTFDYDICYYFIIHIAYAPCHFCFAASARRLAILRLFLLLCPPFTPYAELAPVMTLLSCRLLLSHAIRARMPMFHAPLMPRCSLSADDFDAMPDSAADAMPLMPRAPW